MTQPQAPGNRPTAPDSLTAIAVRLDSIDDKLTRLLSATQDAVNEALLIKEDHKNIVVDAAKTRRRTEELEQRCANIEARLLALEGA